MTRLLKTVKSSKNTNRYKVWLKQAIHDHNISKISLKHNYYEWCCYQSVQSVEKAIKSLLVHGGYRPPRTHKLSVLIGMSNNISDEFRNFKFRFRELEVFTFIARYPFVNPGDNQAPHDYIKLIDAQECLDESEQILYKIKDIHASKSNYEYKDVEGLENIDLESRVASVKNKIVQELNPHKIIIYGGYARGDNHLSTLDILVITDTNLDFVERIRLVREITKGGLPAVSPLVYTPQEFDVLLNQEGESYLESAIEEGRVIYEKPPQ